MQLFEQNGYRKSLMELRRRGGPFQKAADRASAFHDHLLDPGLRAGMPVTNNGESRVKKAVKYDLGHGCRLITVQDSGVIFLCFAGTHDDADEWLEKHRGLTVRVGSDNRPLVTFESFDVDEPSLRRTGEAGFSSKKLIALLEDKQKDQLFSGIPYTSLLRISDAEAHATDDEIVELVNGIADPVQKAAVFDVLIELRADNVEGAVRRVNSFTGELKTVEEAMHRPGEPLETLLDSSDFMNVRVDSEHYRRLIEHYAAHADYQDWMLFMHPDQQQFVDATYPGPAKLSGVSGSGKTCVVVRRAIALANKYESERILVLTLNRSLSILIDGLVNKACPKEIRSRITVTPFFTLCQDLLRSFEPHNTRLYDDVTWKSKEHIDEIWREFYRCELNNFSARVLQRLHDSLISRGIDAEGYIREEFDWIRSATTPDGRDAYLDMERSGRTYPLDETFRRELLEGLQKWEEKMSFVGVTDYLGLANALWRHADRLEPSFRCVLIDESQDFGTVEIKLIRKLVSEGENDVFMCGDAAQQVSSKHQNLLEAGVSIPGARSHKLFLNYRNSRQILELAHAVLVDNLSEQMISSKDFEVLDPKFANFGGPSPLLLGADTIAHELWYAAEFARQEALSNPTAKICIAVCGFTEHELASFAHELQMPILNGNTKLSEGQVFISDLENTKGFEFQHMIIANCSDMVIPNPLSPPEETFRDLARLYVAMTRARQQLVISHSGNPSRLLERRTDDLLRDHWSTYVEAEIRVEEARSPKRLEELRTDQGATGTLDMSGEAFLYSEHAIGCSPLLIEKLRTLVTGQSKTVRGNPVEWRTIRDALRDTTKFVRSRQAFGPEGLKQFRERFGWVLPTTKEATDRTS